MSRVGRGYEDASVVVVVVVVDHAVARIRQRESVDKGGRCERVTFDPRCGRYEIRRDVE